MQGFRAKEGRRGARREPHGSQKGAKEEPKGGQQNPKGDKREPKGAKESQIAMQVYIRKIANTYREWLGENESP